MTGRVVSLTATLLSLSLVNSLTGQRCIDDAICDLFATVIARLFLHASIICSRIRIRFELEARLMTAVRMRRKMGLGPWVQEDNVPDGGEAVRGYLRL